ncbi:glycine oxidase ThiO [Alkalimarinus sediminis]|uniref:Glycine oxidase ThiO n=1 Tax=Alkalimarinus sediminis TaxID=1632866 RepID=A0A9E8HFW3_9ALTE|nr:glycine oxidase ThiO [Alkalimarinus sediminis]UZW73888.1 glycine oxidase ThiO [Alkalimarinus sediminis]
MKTIIIGAGAIGMMQARELAQAGVEVTLIDKGLCGQEASWAGGGIVSPLYPWRYSEPVTALAAWSQGYYGNLAESLEAESGVDPELTRHGLLMLSIEDQSAALEWASAHNNWAELVEKDAIYKLEPNLREGVGDALWMPQVGSIRNPRLMQALYKSIMSEPLVSIIEESAVSGLVIHADKVTGVKLKDKVINADNVVVTAGAWSGGLLESVGVSLPIEPVRGQMILFNAKPGVVNRVVLNDGKYVIPRRDGRVLAGSTLEYVGFDKQTTEQAKQQLADTAIDMFPVLAEAQIEHHWAGLRPGAPEGVPFIGAVPGIENLYVNSGHFRNGLVLAPAAVRVMTALLLGEVSPLDPTPYELQYRVKQIEVA